MDSKESYPSNIMDIEISIETEKGKSDENENAGDDAEDDYDDLQQKDLVVLLCSKKIQKPKRRKKEKCILGIKPIHSFLQLPIIEKLYFQLNGGFCIYINPESINDINQYREVSIVQVFDNYLEANLKSSQFLKHFDIPIQLLEKSQDIRKYKFAQQLKEFSQLTSQSNESFKQIIKDYSKRKEELIQLNVDRAKYRKQQINKYINENLKEDDFYSIAEFGENFEFQQIEISSLNFSKSFMALLGIDEKDINQFLLHIGMADFIFLAQQERFYGSIYEQLKSKEKYSYQVYKDFMFVTIDKLKIYCDLEIATIDIQYPPHLEYKCNYQPFQLNDSCIFKFNITIPHLKSILKHRMQNKDILENEVFHSQSIEYSLLSSILIDKFYPKEKNLDQDYQTNNQKMCGYKYII